MNISINDIEIFADGLDHPECVAVHPDGSVWAGGEAGQIYKVSPRRHCPQLSQPTTPCLLTNSVLSSACAASDPFQNRDRKIKCPMPFATLDSNKASCIKFKC